MSFRHVVLSVIVVGCVLTAGAGPVDAAGPPPTSGGWVTVETPEQLLYIDDNQASYLSADIQLTSSIALPSGTVWEPLGSASTPFTGTFNGNGYGITGLTVSVSSSSDAGLFGALGNGATVEDLAVSGQITSANGNAGILAGEASGSITIQQVSVSGTVNAGSVGIGGGLLGEITAGSTTVTEGDSTASVSAGYAGGLIGNMNSGSLANVYATGSIDCTQDYGGGLVGDLGGGSVTNAYAAGPVTGIGYRGALVGLYNSFTSPSLSGLYFDPSVSGQSNASGYNRPPSGVTSTDALNSQSTFVGWDFRTVWAITPSYNNGFPYLQDVPRPSTGGGSSPPQPPSLSTVTIPLDGQSVTIVGNMGLNSPTAIVDGTYVGFLEERAALAAGATAASPEIDSSYLSAILSGNGAGNQVHVSAVQQGQFAALYERLNIVPTWTATVVVTSVNALTALQKAEASTLALENYLVQIDGYSWPAAESAVSSLVSSLNG